MNRSLQTPFTHTGRANCYLGAFGMGGRDGVGGALFNDLVLWGHFQVCVEVQGYPILLICKEIAAPTPGICFMNPSKKAKADIECSQN